MSDDRRDHLRSLFADHFAGRLEGEELADFRRALAEDSSLAAEYEFASQLQEQWTLAESLGEQRLIEIADGAAATPEEEERLRHHAADRRHLEMLRTVGTIPSTATTPVRARTPRPRWLSEQRWAMGALAVAAALLLYLGPTADHGSLRDFAQFGPLPVRTVRSTAEPRSFDDWRLRGLDAYRQGQWRSAAALLDSAATLREDDVEVPLYRASALAQLGQYAPAHELLKHAADLAGGRESITSPLHEEILWQLAQCALALNERGEAVDLLESLRDHRGARAASATRQLDALASG